MLRTRVLTALAMVAALYIGTVWLPPFWFALVLAAVMLPALLEWNLLMGLKSAGAKASYVLLFYGLLAATAYSLGLHPEADYLNEPLVGGIMGLSLLFWIFVLVIILRYPDGQPLWATPARIGLMGLFCILPVWAGLVQLKYMAVSGYLVLAVIALVSIVDIGAYFSGRTWGKRKLAPSLSPKKTWAGFWGGVASCVALGALLSVAVHIHVQPLDVLTLALLLVASVLLACISVVGDLYESMLKRHQGLKDSGRSLPGHGGLLDRVDSLLAATPVFVLTLLYLLADMPWY